MPRTHDRDEPEGLETGPRRQAESIPDPSTEEPKPPENVTNADEVGHQTAANAQAASFENQNLYGDVQGASYAQASGEQVYTAPKTAKGDPYRDPSMIGVTHTFFVPLARDVLSVRTGTPIKPGPNGWVIAQSGGAEAMAHSYAEGGTRVPATKLATLETYERQFRSGDAVGIEYVDDRGAIVWSKGGPFLALNDSQVLVDLTRTNVAGALDARAQTLISALLRGVAHFTPRGIR